MVTQVTQEYLANQEKSAKSEAPGPREEMELLEHWVCVEQLVVQDLGDLQGLRDLPVHKELLDLLGLKAPLDLLETKVLLVQAEPKDQMVLRVQMEHKDLKAQLDQWVNLA